jgi:hypothetical protein
VLAITAVLSHSALLSAQSHEASTPFIEYRSTGAVLASDKIKSALVLSDDRGKALTFPRFGASLLPRLTIDIIQPALLDEPERATTQTLHDVELTIKPQADGDDCVPVLIYVALRPGQYPGTGGYGGRYILRSREGRLVLFSDRDILEPSQFILSKGKCHSDSIRETRLSDDKRDAKQKAFAKQEAQRFANELKTIVVPAQKDFNYDVEQLTVVNGLQNVAWPQQENANSFYVLDELANLFSKTRSALGKIDTQKGAAIRSSVEATIPDNDALIRAASKTNPRFIPKTSGDRMIQRVRKLFTNLVNATSHITLDLTVLVSPEPGNVTLSTNDGKVQLTGTTSHVITTVYRGAYKIVIEEFGYQTVTDNKDFLSQSGDVLDCHELRKTSDPRPPLHCDLQ